MIAEVGVSISRMPGPPRGPSYRITSTSPAVTVPSMMRSVASSSEWNTRAVPLKKVPSLPVILATAPVGARLPYRMRRWLSFLIGLSRAWMMSCSTG